MRYFQLIGVVSLIPAVASAEPAALSAGELSFDIDQEAQAAAPEFGLAGQTRLTIGTGVAFDLEQDDDSTDFNLNVAWSRFVVDDFEIRLELGGWYFDQEPDAAWGINPNFVLRWHLVNKNRWSIYTDAGIGFALTSDDVPAGGTSANFTPRAGVGLTHAIGTSANRLELGVRWHHISNARLTGDANNPDRDGIMGYAGISFPF
ncbi:MAG: acyloxyacyl hydrolase [Planctomycetota bacterium]|nr:MAG: acyloxyacyl hydrolase [Planctomycetota bacterium]